MQTLRPAQRFDPELLLAAQGGGAQIGVRAAVFDVDGVLTDGSLWIGAEGEQLKAFHVLDGHGLVLLRRAGIEPWIVTGRDSPAVRRRVADLGLDTALYGVRDKLAAVQGLLQARGLAFAELAAIGDDWPDLPVLLHAGFSAAPPGAHAEVRAVVRHVTTAPAGLGAAREFCDLLLMASGHYARLLQEQLTTLDGR